MQGSTVALKRTGDIERKRGRHAGRSDPASFASAAWALGAGRATELPSARALSRDAQALGSSPLQQEPRFWRRLTTARRIVPYAIGAAPSPAGLLCCRPGATGWKNNRRTPGYEGL